MICFQFNPTIRRKQSFQRMEDGWCNSWNWTYRDYSRRGRKSERFCGSHWVPRLRVLRYDGCFATPLRNWAAFGFNRGNSIRNLRKRFVGVSNETDWILMFKCYEMKRISEIVLGMEIMQFFDVPFKVLIFCKISTHKYTYKIQK